jgi:hypothetical protein
MTRGSDGKHRLEVKLPVGAELHYKYTLGDSVWSGEQAETGKFFVRRLIVPDHDLLIEDEVVTWNNSEFGEISLITRVPENFVRAMSGFNSGTACKIGWSRFRCGR